MITCTARSSNALVSVNRYALCSITLVLLGVLCSSQAFAANLSLGSFAQGVYSGTEPFNTSDKCYEPGDDCSSNDDRVRTGDLIQYSWVITTDGFDADE